MKYIVTAVFGGLMGIVAVEVMHAVGVFGWPAVIPAAFVGICCGVAAGSAWPWFRRA